MMATVRIEKDIKLSFTDARDGANITVKLTTDGGLEFINEGLSFMSIYSDDVAAFIHGLKILKETT